MAAITIDIDELAGLSKIPKEEIEDLLTIIGIPIESSQDNKLELEITPNRPDLLSVEGLARACRAYKFSIHPQYKAENKEINIIVNKNVATIRPYIGGVYIEGLEMDEKFLDSLIQLQEKLHNTIGRKRKKMAIGIHDIENATAPFRYFAAKPDEIKFKPLGFDKEMTLGQILKEHPKGIEYAHLIKDICPILADKKSNVLSFPPIINGEFSKLKIGSKKIFIDCTGTDQATINTSLNILSCAFADRGWKVYQIKVNSKIYEVFKAKKIKFNANFTNKVLGIKLSIEQQRKLLSKFGHEMKGNFVFVPPYRADVFGQIDLVEDIAIAYGYNNFKPTKPQFYSEPKINDEFEFLAELLIGLGFFEVSSWILTNQNTLKKAAITNALKVSNPLTEEFSTLRPALYPNILEIFSKSKSAKMPQKIFEIGPIIEPTTLKQKTNCCFAIAQPKANFNQIHSYLKGILNELNLEYKLEEKDYPIFIPGRSAIILSNQKDIGFIGEIHPDILENFSIEQPVALVEINLENLNK